MSRYFSETYYGWFEFRWSPLRALRAGDWRYIEAPVPELDDLAEVPGETVPRGLFPLASPAS